MARTRDRILVVGLIIGLTSLVATASSAGDPTKQVEVVNGVGKPVPVDQQGPVSVEGSVGIAGTPTVNLAGVPAVGIDPSANVVQVQTPPIEPFAANGNPNFEDGEVSSNDSFQVPDDRRLLIEQFHATVGIPGGQKLNSFVLFVQTGGQIDNWRFVAEPAGDSNLENAQEQVTLYADPGSTVVVRANRFPYNTGSGAFEWSISGRLIEA